MSHSSAATRLLLAKKMDQEELVKMRLAVSFFQVVIFTIACFLCVLPHNSATPSSLGSSTTLTTRPGHFFKPSQSNSSRSPAIKCDKYFCDCNGDKARCTGQGKRKFHYLPQLPAQIRDFRMFRSKFYHLNRTMMLNLSNFQLTAMNLTDNQIYHIAPDTFADFPQIKYLDLGTNYIQIPELKATVKGMSSTQLSTLSLGNMGFSTLPEDFFDMFYNRTFQKVDLQQNQFTVFNSALFSPFWRVESVSMAQNLITAVNMSVRVNIRILILKENHLQQFPDLSLQQSQTRGDRTCKEAFYYLQTISISGNPFLRISPQVLRGDCLPQLRRMDIGWSTVLKTLENNFIADLPRLQILMVNHMTQLERYQSYVFNSTSLRRLYLDMNRRFDLETVDIPNMFRHCPNLEELQIVDTKLDMSMKRMWTLLVPLKSVKILNLQRNRHGNIPEDLLWRLPNLNTLSFTGANLNSYGLGRALINVTTLKRLNVQGNSITVVNESTLPWEFRKNVEWLDLSENPFSCTCANLWFRNWLDDVEKNKSVKVNFKSKQYAYRCRTPLDMARTSLYQFRPTAESCAVKNPFVLVGIIVACFLMGMITVLSLIYRYRWHLRYYVYRLRRRGQYVQVPGALMHLSGDVQMFPYDAYLAHSSKDLDWICAELLPIIECENGLKVFLEERDGTAGTVILDNIARYMDESARVLLLISDDYNREGWRQCEFEHILFAAFEQHKDVIVLLLGDVEAGKMTKDMRRMLTRGTFLQWGPGEEARRVFRNGLKVALKTQDNHFQSLC